MIGDVSYKDYKKNSDIHGTVLYPAVMVAPVQKCILEELLDNDEIKIIFDPFHGSGTSLYESMEINQNIKLIGSDINPLANLITKTKLSGVNLSVYEDIKLLKKYISEKNYDRNFTFDNIDKWFRKDIAKSLSIIREAIRKIESMENRNYFWCMMCDIIRKYSNTRSSTYKLHIKEQEVIKNIKNNVLEDYVKIIELNTEKYKKKSNNFKLYKCDILKKINEFQDDMFDLSITSPPYGENATTVSYGQFSMLALRWIDEKDLEIDGWELENYSIIDSKSLGGSTRISKYDEFEKILMKPYLSKISERKQKKVINFFSDYFEFLKELCRVSKKYIVLTLGNRTVDGVNINLTEISIKYLEKYGFKNKNKFERVIPKKRTPRVISKKDGKIVESMNLEYIIIHYKNN